jgi:NADH-quinone oxidoreductase subunit G
MKVAELGKLDRVLLVGSFLRKDQPLVAQRLRQAVKRGAQVSVIHAADDDLLMSIAGKLIAAPSLLPERLAQVVKAVAELKGMASDLPVTVGAEARKIAESLVSGQDAAILVGNFAQQHKRAATVSALVQRLAGYLGARFGFLGEAANTVGGHVAKAMPADDGKNAVQMLDEPRKAYLVVGAEPELDCADGARAMVALKQAETVVVLSPFKSAAAMEYADAILPISPFTETSGTFVNMEGRVQSFQAVNRPWGETRPGWKVLRVLANLLKLEGFDHESSEAVRDEIFGGAPPEFVDGLDNAFEGIAIDLSAAGDGVERIADVPIYFADAMVRRASSLQKTKDAAVPTARMNAATLARFGVKAGEPVKVSGGGTLATLVAALEAGLPDNCLRLAAGHVTTATVGAMSGALTVEKV